MAIRRKYDALSASFMILSFATAALLVGVQSSGLFTNRSAASSQLSSRNSTQNTATASLRPQSAVGSSSSAATPTAEPGIARIVTNSFHPVALIRESRLVVNLKARQVLLYQDGTLQATYEIAVGRDGWETPTGEFHVLNMQQHPVWQNPITGETIPSGANNPLGSRWIGFWSDGIHQIGFHGTNQEELIGQAVSHGCLRMRDQDIQTLYTQVAIGTPVVVEQ